MHHYVRACAVIRRGVAAWRAHCPYVLCGGGPASPTQPRRLVVHRAVARPAALIVTYAARVSATVAAGSAADTPL